MAIVEIPEEIWEEIDINPLLYPIKEESIGGDLETLQFRVTHEMTHAYIHRKTHHENKKQVFGEIEEAAASAVSEVLNKDKKISVEVYQSNEEEEGYRKKVFVTYLHAFADIIDDEPDKYQAIDKIRRKAKTFIKDLNNNPSKSDIEPLRTISEARYQMMHDVIETLAESEKYLLHPLSMLNLVEPRYFKHLRRLEEDLELSVYLEEVEAFPSKSLMEGESPSDGSDIADIEKDEEMEEFMSSRGHREDIEDLISDLEGLDRDFSGLEQALENIIEVWHEGDEHLERLEEEEADLVEKFDDKLDGMKKIIEEGSSLTPNEIEKRFPEEEIESVLQTFLKVHQNLSREGKSVAKELKKACENAERNGLRDLKGKHDKMPLTLQEELNNIIKSVEELKKICEESINRFEVIQNKLEDAETRIS
jgi:hypothetical protein